MLHKGKNNEDLLCFTLVYSVFNIFNPVRLKTAHETNVIRYSGYACASWNMTNSIGFATSSTAQSYKMVGLLGFLGGKKRIPFVPLQYSPVRALTRKI